MDILKFSADRFCAISAGLASIDQLWERIGNPLQDEPIKDETRQVLKRFVSEMVQHCETIGLSMSLCSVNRFSSKLEQSKTMGELKGSGEEIGLRIRDEIADNLFLFIPKTHVRFYNTESLFGPEVETAFPSASYDIQEAGKCLALHRGTACVFHAMRVLECGLGALAANFNVPSNHKAWGQIIEHIEKAIAKIPRDPNKPSDWKEYRQFCAEAASQFTHFKYAWRNYTAHARIKYTPEEAEQIFRHVHDFMKHLAKQLKEPERP